MNFITMSFLAGMAIVSIVILRCIAINRLPKRLFLTLWNIVLFHLLLIMSLPFEFETGQFQKPVQELFLQFDTVYIIEQHPKSDNMLHTIFNEYQTVIITIWFMVAVILLSVLFCQYIAERGKLQQALPMSGIPQIDEWLRSHRIKRQIRILVSDRIMTPLTYGSIKPRIILPKSMDLQDTAQLQYVLDHEFVHIRRFDSIRKILLLLIVCFHWFNPFVWIMFYFLQRDIELYCDERVIAHKDAANRKAYATTLINASARKAGMSCLTNGFGRNAIEERVISVIHYQKPSLIKKLLSSIIILCSVTILILADSMQATSTTSIGVTVSGVSVYDEGMPADVPEETADRWIRIKTDTYTGYIAKSEASRPQDEN